MKSVLVDSEYFNNVAPIETDLKEVVDDSLAFSHWPNLKVVNLVPSGTMVPVDVVRFEHVLFNIIKNAAEALGGREGRVVLRTEKTDGEIRLFVEDNGPGIAPEALSHVFDIGFTTKGRSGGDGTGLDVIKTIVEAHGGRIWAENRLTGGARFVIALSLGRTDPAEIGPIVGGVQDPVPVEQGWRRYVRGPLLEDKYQHDEYDFFNNEGEGDPQTAWFRMGFMMRLILEKQRMFPRKIAVLGFGISWSQELLGIISYFSSVHELHGVDYVYDHIREAAEGLERYGFPLDQVVLHQHQIGYEGPLSGVLGTDMDFIYSNNMYMGDPGSFPGAAEARNIIEALAPGGILCLGAEVRQDFVDELRKSGRILFESFVAYGTVIFQKDAGQQDAPHAGMTAQDPGGIDLGAGILDLTVRSDGKGISFDLSPEELESYREAPGLVPVVLDVYPLESLFDFFSSSTPVGGGA
ncbi:MAG: HAMP domain-containing histidine kinase, partial [Elusimicrobia bacterium]|nr:HAMP domain-containing histidine kinase [Elusimicrobiota bacterium]